MDLRGQHLGGFGSARVVFEGPASFEGSTFTGGFDSTDLVFNGPADFTSATFTGRFTLDNVVFTGPALFAHATFEHRSTIRNTVFRAEATFRDASFARYTRFVEAEFEDEAWFQQVGFHGDVLFDGVTFRSQARLTRALFEGAASLTLDAPLTDFSLSTFRRRARIEVADGTLKCDRTVFESGVRLTSSGPAEIVLHDVHFGAPSAIAAAPATITEYRLADRPRLLSVLGTDLTGLTLSSVDLSRCSFGGAHNLHQLAIEDWNSWGHTPRGLWVTRRIALADERRFRARTGSARRRRRWAIPGDDQDAAVSGNIQGDYHALRRMHEEAKDEPAVTEFYYGEMEMRRIGLWQELRVRLRERWWRGVTATLGEWLLVSLYWLLSGYGVRVWRALTALAVVIVTTSAALVQWGFPGAPVAYGDAVRFSVRAATSLLRGTDVPLTPAGEWIELVLRLLAPLLLALALLAVRSRVRR
ncbi:pentapeptide repeat-containing protein [Acrocarpospora pleiomorpha]|uniref:pentapeptide repeat-containing protein n=1 Tax=Acrocarpospora pleiomorpha TaxID=90975 RepID=UPI0014782B97|nr:pentapeptide repeat-containing protein [Acrocarpospora pleiomorpha]